MLRIRKSESYESKEINEIFIGKHSIINALEVFIKLNGFDELFFVLMIFELVNNFFDEDLFFMIAV